MMMKLIIYFSFILFFSGCQTKPTIIKEEVVNLDFKNTVLVDTRDAFNYTSYHISGSVNLNSGDFLVLKNPKTGKRILDPDINQTVERIAKRGVSPRKSVILISDKKDSPENKKWQWFLRQLDVRDITLMALDEYLAQRKSIVPQALPESVPVWEVKNIKNILKKADQCFVSWSDAYCN